MEKKGIATDRGNINREIKHQNMILREISRRIKALLNWIRGIGKEEKTETYNLKSTLPSKENLLSVFENLIRKRDTTIKYFNEIIKEDFEIRWFVESLGDDTLAFCILPNNLWSSLENEFSKEVVDYYFMTISLESVMFDLDVDSVFSLISLRKDNNKVPFVELLKKLK